MKIRILIVEDQKLVRDGLRALLEGQPGMEVVGDRGTAARGWRWLSPFSHPWS